MSAEAGERLTISVGRREFDELTGAWAAYREVTQGIEAVDPVLAMQKTGSVLRSLDRLVASLTPEPAVPVID